jgi:glycosyltransferase involved in cell wall biosynthesis
MPAQRRILILVENLPVPFDRRVWQEACALRDAGYHVTVICPRMRGFHQPEEVLEGIHILRHWISSEAKSVPGFLLEYASALLGQSWLAWKAWRRGGFDLIHLCNPPDLLFLVAAPFRLLFGTRVIFDVHDLWPEMFEAKFRSRGLLHRLVRLAERATLALAHVIIATNESVRRIVSLRGALHAEDAFVVRTAPASLDTAAPPDDSLRRGMKHLIGYIGVMGSADGVDLLLDAAAELAKQRNDVHFLLMGSGPEHAALLAKRDALHLQTVVEMPGRVSDALLCTALQTMDLGIACDPRNAYNDHCTMNKVLEYMAFAKPLVMFRTVEGEYSAAGAARYVDENDPRQLAAAISDLLDAPDLRQSMGSSGYERLTHELSWQKSTQQLLHAYQRALS